MAPARSSRRAHAAGKRAGAFAGDVGEAEAFEQFVRPGRGGPPVHAVQPAHHVQVFEGRELLVHGGVLPGQAQVPPHQVRIG